MGTPYYMSPEQAKGNRDVDHRADLYAVGVILYEAVAGEVPFNAESFNELLFKIVLEQAVPLTEKVPGTDPDFSALVQKAMAREPSERFASAADFQAALQAWLSGQPLSLDATAALGTPGFDRTQLPDAPSPLGGTQAGGRPPLGSHAGTVGGLPAGTSGGGQPRPGTMGTWSQTSGFEGASQGGSKKLFIAAAAGLLLVVGAGGLVYQQKSAAAAQAAEEARRAEESRHAEEARRVEEEAQRHATELARLEAEKVRMEAEKAKAEAELKASAERAALIQKHEEEERLADAARAAATTSTTSRPRASGAAAAPAPAPAPRPAATSSGSSGGRRIRTDL